MLLLARRGLLVHRASTLSTHARRMLCSAPARPTLDTPFISDTIPLAEGRLGTVVELLADVGQSVGENEIIAVVETDKVSLDVKASRSGVVAAVLVEMGDEVNEKQPLYELQE